MNAIRNFLTACTLLFLTGCANSRQFVAMPSQSKSISNPTKARIYVMRPATVAYAVTMEVTDGGNSIGYTGARTYLCWERDAGDVVLTTSKESAPPLRFLVEANKVYYVFQHVRMNAWIPWGELELISDPLRGQAILKKCKAASADEYGN